VELVCVDIRRKRQVSLPLSVPEITRVAFLKILRVTVSSHLTFSEHIQHTISTCAQTPWKSSEHMAWLILCFSKFTKLLYGLISSTHLVPGGVFIKASDRQRIDNFIRRSVKSGFCPADLQSCGGFCFTRLCAIHYTFCTSFFRVSLQQARITTSDHVNIKKTTRKQLVWLILILLTDCYFLTTYSCMLFSHLSFLSAQQRSVFCLINEYDDDDDDKVFNACPKAAWEPVTLRVVPCMSTDH